MCVSPWDLGCGSPEGLLILLGAFSPDVLRLMSLPAAVKKQINSELSETLPLVDTR